AVPPSAIATLPPPAWLLLVENWTTFVRQAGLRQVGELVVFTGGFPSVAWSSAFSRMISRWPPTTRILHWGDLDVGGFRIYAVIAGIAAHAGLTVQPWRMNNLE